MTEHKGLPVAGYQPQSGEKVAIVNDNKELEERVLRKIDAMKNSASEVGFDGRWLAIAATQIELGFMALNRAVFRPGRVDLPDDHADDIADLKASNERMADILSSIRNRFGLADNESILERIDGLLPVAKPQT
ncbi:DUF7681 family protein [Pleomorphomonas koreensis]|uniref:Acb2/Tad1 domain-containing protein n=1 Tax=Pleomorphomonas koreensis TaxID=257440 RepID=UPI00040EEA14|nr:hypothetical protein [Pleomorphomonas koreensis]